jgi:2-phosphosulfolactate phosphatase
VFVENGCGRVSLEAPFFPIEAMKVQIIQGPKPLLRDGGIHIVVDVIRAFTVAHIAMAQGAHQIRLVESIPTAFALKGQSPESILAGERDGLPVPGFDLPNSPYKFSQLNLEGKTLILKTTYGTEAALHALHGAQAFVAGFINAKKTALFVKHLETNTHEKIITIIASHPTSDEDLACAQYMQGLITGRNQITVEEVTRRIRMSDCAKKFHDQSQTAFDPRDLEICAKESDSAVVLRVAKDIFPTIKKAVV